MSDPQPAAEPPLVRDVYPDFSAELISLLNAEGESELGISAYDLRVVAKCGCGDDLCQGFYTAPRPNGPYGAGHRNVALSPERGMIVLDVVEQRIMFVEVLDHAPLSRA